MAMSGHNALPNTTRIPNPDTFEHIATYELTMQPWPLITIRG